MTINEFRKMNRQERIAYGKSIPIGKTRDNKDNLLTFRNNRGYWEKHTYDTNENELTHIDSTGFWGETTYDIYNNLITLLDSNGIYWENTYNKTGNKLLAYKDSSGMYQINDIKVSEEEYDAFIKENKLGRVLIAG